ncbi:MAG: acetyl-CoA carboxylase biotin carboxyl carrier protein [Nitrospirota bacterium]|nr:acetyl-CoA carboxylase biotin carboxyl carrier protein [Nitrospirota bacterium]
MDTKKIKDLISFLKETGFAEVEIEEEGTKVRVLREHPQPAQTVAPMAMSAMPQMMAAPAAAPVAAPAAPLAAEAGAARTGGKDVRIPEPETGRVITSPIVGTFYRAPAPDKPAYAENGAKVRKGQVVCIVEAMKLMNEIESEFDGTVSQILVEDGDPVEFGQPLMRIEQ